MLHNSRVECNKLVFLLTINIFSRIATEEFLMDIEPTTPMLALVTLTTGSPLGL